MRKRERCGLETSVDVVRNVFPSSTWDLAEDHLRGYEIQTGAPGLVLSSHVQHSPSWSGWMVGGARRL